MPVFIHKGVLGLSLTMKLLINGFGNFDENSCNGSLQLSQEVEMNTLGGKV